jgi:predicted dehydrogenase
MMISERPSVVLVGLAGYGEAYASALLDDAPQVPCHLIAVVEPNPERSPRASQLRTRTIPTHASLADFYRSGHADLVIISSPIHAHCPQTCLALAHGSNVLCEKPPAATVQEVDEMIAAEAAAARLVAVGFQWSFTASIRQLKDDIRAGLFGAPVSAAALTLWPRARSYYTRNAWAGRQRDEAGNWILDSPANNAMAHDLHNLLFLLGDEPGRSARPVEILAETYRANPIENYDTVAARIRTDHNVHIVFLASHALIADSDPAFIIECDRAVIRFDGGFAPIRATFRDSSFKEYPSPNSQSQMTKLWWALDAATHPAPSPCDLHAARAHTLCINGIQESVPRPVVFPADLLRSMAHGDDCILAVSGLAEVLRECYARRVLPHELGATWARPGRLIDLSNYRSFPNATS